MEQGPRPFLQFSTSWITVVSRLNREKLVTQISTAKTSPKTACQL